MPPKKKTRVPIRKASTPAREEDSTIVDTPETIEPVKKPSHDLLKDPWTDEQETSLFKGIIRWKPAGIHKHFRMIALSEYLRNHGYDPKVQLHTRIPGIWEKLGSLYNLDVIDERENSFDYGEDDAVERKYLDFSLPDEEFGNMMWVRGMAPSDALSSPPRLHEASEPSEVSKKRKRGDTMTTSKARASTIEDTDDAKSSPAPSPAVRGGRGTRGGKRSSSRLKGESSDRQASKETTVDEVDERIEEKADMSETAEDEHEDEDADDGSPSPRAPRTMAKAGRGGRQARGASSTRKSTRRK